MLAQEPVPITPIQNHAHIVVTCLPGILEECAAKVGEIPLCLITQEIQGLAQRRSPRLVPTRLTAGVTATVSRPSSHSVRATPRRPFSQWTIIYFNLPLGLMVVQVFRVVCDPKARLFSLDLQSMGQTNIAKLEVVSVGFAVGGHIYQVPCLRHPDEAID